MYSSIALVLVDSSLSQPDPLPSVAVGKRVWLCKLVELHFTGYKTVLHYFENMKSMAIKIVLKIKQCDG